MIVADSIDGVVALKTAETILIWLKHKTADVLIVLPPVSRTVERQSTRRARWRDCWDDEMAGEL